MKNNIFKRLLIVSVLLSPAILSSCMQAEPSAAEDKTPGLKDVFAKNFRIGTAVNKKQIRRNSPGEQKLISKHFNTITSENVLKWNFLHPEPDVYDFTASDEYVEYGEKHDMFIVGTAILWHSGTPDWVYEDADGNLVDREALLARLKEHIFTVVGRYKGRVDAWDVVNETIMDDGQMRDSKWATIIGDDFVEKAFEYTHQADPEAELYYNDYNMWLDKHREGAVRLVKNLQAKNIRIDGIGFQGHWGLGFPTLEILEASLVACSKLGIKIDITELDITVLPYDWGDRGADVRKSYELHQKLNPYTDRLPDEIQEKLAKRYADLFAMFNKYSDNIGRVTFWGAYDGSSWRNSWPVKGRTDYPLLFDRNYEPKPAFDAVIATVEE